jgi:curved DNA-binding protein
MTAASLSITTQDALSLLGLTPGADGGAIAKAFRAAVKAVHPDRRGGDSEPLRRVIEAHDLLTRTAAVRPALRAQSNGVAQKLALEISTDEALFGADRRIETRNGRSLDVHLPAGLTSGDVVRLSAADGGSDVLIQVTVTPREGVSFRGADLWLEVEDEAGASRERACMDVETPRGRRAFVAPRSRQDGGVVLVRFKGQGLPARGGRPAGDMVIRVTVRERAKRGPLGWLTDRLAA